MSDFALHGAERGAGCHGSALPRAPHLLRGPRRSTAARTRARVRLCGRHRLTRRDLQRAAKPHGRIWLSVNGELRQEADVKQMLWDVPHIIAEPSTFYQLRPGDLIFCGTPAGVSPVKPGDQREGGVGGGSRCCASASQPPGVPAD